MNGTWLTKTEIPADRPVYGTFVQLSDKAEADLYALIEELAGDRNKKPGSTAQQVGDLYASFTNEAQLNTLGAEPLKPHLAEIDRDQDDRRNSPTLLGRLSVIGLPGPVGGFIEADAGDPTKVALYLGQGGTALPDRDYYLKDDPKFVEIRAKYQEYLAEGLHARRPAARGRGREGRARSRDRAREDSVDAGREPRRGQDLQQVSGRRSSSPRCPGFDWMAWAKPQGIDKAPEWVIAQPSFFKGFAAMVPTVPLDTWKAWMAAQLITLHAPYLSKAFDDARFEFFGKTLSGQEAQRQRWKRGVQLVNGSMGEALGQLYVAKHFPAAAKARMETMIANLIEAYRQSITELDWMTPDTKKEALAKLAKFSAKIAYPNRGATTPRCRSRPTTSSATSSAPTQLETEYQVGKLGKPVDREEWLMSPQTVNAYYNPVKNEIVFPAAILQPPFFDVTADDAVNYGAIGAVIGHEIGHGFDDQGRRFDGDGKLRDWWKPADETEFQKRAKILVEQFNGYSPIPGMNINGELTLGENIGDLGGLSIAYRAWKISLGGKPSPVIDGLTGDQRFFMGWAQAWRAKAREAYLRRQVLADPHAWAEFRANGPLGNIAGFYDGVQRQARRQAVPGAGEAGQDLVGRC